MAVPTQIPRRTPRKRRPPELRVEDMEILDWDAEIESLPPRPTTVVRFRIVHGTKRPPRITEDAAE